MDSLNFLTSSLIGSKVVFPAHEGSSAEAGGCGTAVLLLSVVDFVPVVVVVVVLVVLVVALDVVGVVLVG